MNAAIFSEDALASTDRLWADAVAHLSRKLGRVTPLDPDQVPADRAAAIAYLDQWAGDDARSWRVEAARFFEDHVPVYLRPDPELNAALRHIQAQGRGDGGLVARPARGGTDRHALPGARQAVHHAGRRSGAGSGGPRRRRAGHGGRRHPGRVGLAGHAPRGQGQRRPDRGRLWTGGNRELLLAAMPTLLAESPGELVDLALSTA